MRCPARLLGALVVLAWLLHPEAVGQPVPCSDGWAGEYPCRNVDLLARLPLNATPDPAESSSDVWGWTDPVTGTEYALALQYDHTAFVDLSDPAAPVVVGTLPVEGETSRARDAKVYADHAFIGTDAPGNPLQVFDLGRLRDVDPPSMPVTFAPDALYPGGSDPHNLAIDEASGFAYLVYVGPEGTCDFGLHIADVSDPLDPHLAGCFPELGDVHDVQCLTYDGPDADYAGRELCFASDPNAEPDPDRLAIVDVTDKQQPTLVGEAIYPDSRYAHQGWLTEDGRYFLMNDEGDESFFGFATRTLVFDVADLDAPEFAFAYTHPTTSTDHNLFVRGDHVYEANYTSGLRILDLTGIDDGTLEEVAYFDTHPEDDSTGFEGAFGVYPFFESGVVVVTDKTRGLFVLQPRLGGAVATEPDAPAVALALSVHPRPVQVRATATLTLEQAQPVRAVLYDLLGRPVQTLHDGLLPAGTTRLSLDVAGRAAGTYLLRVTAGDAVVARSVVVAR